MKTTNNNWFETSVAQLSDPQNQRVWSIIVSLFGDLAQQPTDRISGSALTRIITPMGIKPEAIRVALHRLRKDGWIESTRSGRASIHYLTQYGRSQSAAVTPRIYTRAPVISTDWHALIADDSAGQATLDEVLLLPNYVTVTRNTVLGHGPLPQNQEELLGLELRGVSVPDWLKARIFPSDLTSACQALRTALQAIPSVPADLCPLQIASLRTLIVHRWRRVVLRHPDLPGVFYPNDWPGQDCRKMVFDLLDQLPRPTTLDLDAATRN